MQRFALVIPALLALASIAPGLEIKSRQKTDDGVTTSRAVVKGAETLSVMVRAGGRVQVKAGDRFSSTQVTVPTGDILIVEGTAKATLTDKELTVGGQTFTVWRLWKTPTPKKDAVLDLKYVWSSCAPDTLFLLADGFL